MMVARTDQDSTLRSNSKQIHLLKRCTWWCGGRQVGGLRGRQRAVRRWPAEARLGAPARGSPAPTASCKLDLCLPPSPRHPLPSTTADPSLVQHSALCILGPCPGSFLHHTVHVLRSAQKRPTEVSEVCRHSCTFPPGIFVQLSPAPFEQFLTDSGLLPAKKFLLGNPKLRVFALFDTEF